MYHEGPRLEAVLGFGEGNAAEVLGSNCPGFCPMGNDPKGICLWFGWAAVAGFLGAAEPGRGNVLGTGFKRFDDPLAWPGTLARAPIAL